MPLPKFEDYKAPWEVAEDGTDLEAEKQTVDPAKLKRHLYNLLGDKERLQGTVATLTTERDGVKAKLDEIERKDETEVDRLRRELSEAQSKAQKAGETSIETLKLRVALRKGLTEVQAKRLVGSTEDELEADADDLVRSFGGSGKQDDGEDGEPRRTPKRLHNPGNPGDDEGNNLPEPTIENINKLFPI